MAAFVAFCTFVAFAASGPVGCKRATNESDFVAGTRLGMSPRDVRERFAPGGEGTWQTSLGGGDDTILEWRSTGASKYRSARFEFHLGMLVAIRAHAEGGVTEESVTATPKIVTVVRPSSEGGTDIDILSRDCPTHHDEAESFAAKAR